MSLVFGVGVVVVVVAAVDGGGVGRGVVDDVVDGGVAV